MLTSIPSALLAGALLPLASATPLFERNNGGQNVSVSAQNTSVSACETLEGSLSKASGVFYPPSAEYDNAVDHLSLVNIENATCVVYPGSAKDIASIINLVGKQRVPFGIKGGGHCLNKGCSSTTGVLIAMNRFNETKYDKKSGLVEIGAGQVWDEVYNDLEGTGVSVLGARVTGVGVGGLLLGGGYSWRSNQYGLAIDNLVKYELITPQGKVLTVTEDSYPDLFWGLKGGLNNLGIVTRFWHRALPVEDLIWGGTNMYTMDKFQALFDACVDFDKNNKDDKAVAIVSYIWANGTESNSIVGFYDGAVPGATYNRFRSITPVADNFVTRKLPDHVASYTNDNLIQQRVRYDNADVVLITDAVVDAIANIRPKFAEELQAHGGTRFSLSAEPVSDNLFRHSKGGLFPHDLKNKARMIVLTLVWQDESEDDYFEDLAQRIVDELHNAAIADGQDLTNAPRYPNLGRGNATLESMYGSENVARMRGIVQKWDPERVMTLAGGFKFQ